MGSGSGTVMSVQVATLSRLKQEVPAYYMRRMEILWKAGELNWPYSEYDRIRVAYIHEISPGVVSCRIKLHTQAGDTLWRLKTATDEEWENILKTN